MAGRVERLTGLGTKTLLSIAVIAGTCLVSAPAIGAQSAAPAKASLPVRPSYEVASIKLNPDCTGDHQDEQFAPGRVTVTCIKLANLIQAAYGTFANGANADSKRLRLFGLPQWAESSRYNITAKASGDAPMEQMFGPMLQVLLEDRFGLKVHRGTRELPVYTMTVAKGRLKIQQSKEGACISLDLNHGNEPSTPFCGRMTGRGNGLHVVDDAYGMSMGEIAGKFLTNRLDRPVIDKTGLKGLFDAHLEFDRDSAPLAPNNGDTSGSSGPSIFTAVQEQLGLKLSPDRGPVEVLVIDQVARLSEN